MANITGNVTINPTSDSDTTNEFYPLSTTVGGTRYDLPQHVLYNQTANDLNSNNINGDFNNAGTNIQPGGQLTIGPGAEVWSGGFKLRGTSTADGTAGGILAINGGTVSTPRLAAQGFVGNNATGTATAFRNRPDTELPTLSLSNGAIINMSGVNGDGYRAFLGNWAAGRIIGSDFTVNFSGDNYSDGFGASGTTRSNFFYGNQSNISNYTINNASAVEAIGPVTSTNATIRYSQLETWFTNLSGSMAYMGGQPDAQATFGDTTIEVGTLDIFPGSGSDYYQISRIREAANHLTVTGEVNTVHGTNTTPLQNHFFGFQGTDTNATRDLNRRFEFRQELGFSATRISSTGANEGNAAAKVVLMDQRNLIQIDHDTDDMVNGSVPTETYLWYNMPNHGLANNFGLGAGNNRVVYGYPTGADAASTIHYSTADSTTRTNATIIHSTSNAGLSTISSPTTVNTRAARDLRRFDFRLGSMQFGYYPYYSTHGSTTHLTAAAPTGNLIRQIENEMSELKTGINTTTVLRADPILNNISQSDVSSLVTFQAPGNATDSLIVRCGDTDLTLDDVYRATHAWAYNNLDNANTYTISDLTTGNSDFNYGHAANGAIGNVNTDNVFGFLPATGTTLLNSGDAWTDVNRIVINPGDDNFDVIHGSTDVRHSWTRGYLLLQQNTRTNWALLRFTRSRNEVFTSGGQDYPIMHIEEIVASSGNTGSKGAGTGGWFFQLMELEDSSEQLVPDNNIRDYLWNTTVQLAPLESTGTSASTAQLILDQNTNGSHTLTKGTLQTLNLSAATDMFNAGSQPVRIDVSGAGRVTNTPRGSVTAPGIPAGTTITSQIDMARGMRYFVEGDLTGATINVTGSGSAQVEILLVGNGLAPANYDASDILVNKGVSVTLQLPSGYTWDTDNLDSEMIYNMVTYQGERRDQIDGTLSGPPAVPPPSGVIHVNSPNRVSYDTANGVFVANDRWKAVSLSSSGVITDITTLNTTQPASWDQTTWQVNTGQSIGIALSANDLSGSALTTVVNWISTANTRNHLVMYSDTENWAIYELDPPDGGPNPSTFRSAISELVDSRGVPGSDMIMYFGVNSSGETLNIYDSEIAYPISADTRVVSAQGGALTYSYTINERNNAYFGFAGRNDIGGIWFNPVYGNTELTDAVTVNLTTMPITHAPQAGTTAAGLAAHVTHITDTDVFADLLEPASSTSPMQISLDDTAVNGTAGDGLFIHRLVQQKENYLRNTVRGFYPTDGWTNNNGEVVYSATGETNVQWIKSTANNNIVAFAVPVVDSGGASANLDVTTSNVQTYIVFSGAAAIGVLTQEQIDRLATRADVWAANAAL